MKGQKGQVFILVLILLAVGTLVIVPVLDYTTTGLRSQRIAEDALTTRYVADAAVEDALWQMLNNLDYSFSADFEYDFVFGLDRFKVDIKIPSVPESEWTQDKEIYIKVEVEPNWLEANAVDPTFTYIIRVNSPQWDLTDFGFSLPLGLTYTGDSTLYIEPELSYEPEPWGTPDPDLLDPDIPIDDLVRIPGTNPIIYDDEEGKEVLSWNLYGYLSGFHGRRLFIQTFQVTGSPDWGVHYVEPSFAFEDFTILTGETGALGVAFYTITLKVEGVTYQVVVAYEADGFEIISYQIVE